MAGVDPIDAFTVALDSLGVEVSQVADGTYDVLIDLRGRTLRAELEYVRTATPASLSSRLRDRRPPERESDVVPVIVADRIAKASRDLLRSRGWGWLDLRGHLHIEAPGILVDAAVPPFVARTPRTDAFAGTAGLEVAAVLLTDPGRWPGVREIARQVKRSPSTISEVFKALRAEGLVDENGHVEHQELFWRLAESWRSATASLASRPEPGSASVNSALRLGLEDPESTAGWALTDTMAASLYGAPVAIRSNYPPDFYVPSEAVFRRAIRLLGSSHGPADVKATIKVAPIPMVCERRVDAARRRLGNERWPLAHPLFVALDLAGDPGRGREVLDGWHPPEPWRRVW